MRGVVVCGGRVDDNTRTIAGVVVPSAVAAARGGSVRGV